MSRSFDVLTSEQTGSLTDAARRGLGWWLDELRALVPSRWLARAEPRHRFDVELALTEEGRVAVAFDETPPIVLPLADLAPVLAELARAETAGGLKIRLDVPPGLCLVRRSLLPRQSLRDAREVLLSELVDTTPLKVEEVHSDWYVEAEDPATGTLHVNHVILGRDRIAPLTALLALHGLALTAITVGRQAQRQKPVDLLSSDDIGFRTFLRQMPVAAWIAWGLAAVMLVGLPVVASARLDARIESLRQQRTLLMAAMAKQPPLDESSLADMTRLAAAPPLAALIDAIADHLPPEAWLTRLAVTGNRVELRFGAGDTARTAQSLAASRAFAADPVVTADGILLRLASGREAGHD